jgi:hypothetical protein
MKLGTLLLGTAAGLMVASAAQAADLPGEVVPTAVDYVKVCDTFGAGFFYIPGTETCLDISGRVRFRVEYTGGDAVDDTLDFHADGRLQFDTRSSTEYGTLRTFFQISDGYGGGAGSDDNGVEIDLAFIQLGYLTVGRQGDVANGDVLYGDASFAYVTGDSDLTGIAVLVDDLGGGFYVGAGIYGTTGSLDETIWADGPGDDFNAQIQAAVGLADQPWGSVDLSGVYWSNAFGDDIWTVKATADLSLAEGFNARLVAAYADFDSDDAITLAAAASYAFSDAATVYAGLRYDILDGDDDFGANVGVDYTVVDGLVLTAEFAYDDNAGADESYAGLLQLSRSW